MIFSHVCVCLCQVAASPDMLRCNRARESGLLCHLPALRAREQRSLALRFGKSQQSVSCLENHLVEKAMSYVS